MMYWGKTIVAVPPGETIKERLNFIGMKQKEFANRMDMSEKHICHLLAGDTHITTDVALRLESVLDIEANFWISLEAKYREQLGRAKAENEMAEDIEFSKKLPYNEITKLGWLNKSTKPADKIQQLRAYFGVSKLILAPKFIPQSIAYRRLSYTEKSYYTLMLWVREAQRRAWQIKTGKINIAKINQITKEIKLMTQELPEVFFPKLKALLASCGIALVPLQHLKGSFLHGASFYDGSKIVLGITLRSKEADRFWFSLMHELAHISLGHLSKAQGTSADDEVAADNWSREQLTNSQKYGMFVTAGEFTANKIKDFANKVGISACIVVGRLQKDGYLKYNQLNNLKTQYDFAKVC